MAEDEFDDLEQERLHFAAQDGDLEQVRTILAAGDDPNAFDEIGHTPLHYAAEEEHLDVVRLLVEKDADVNANCEAQIGNTPLSHVSGRCSYEMAKLLIDLGADPTIRGWMQLTALDHSGERKKPEGRRVHELLVGTANKPGSSGSR